MTPQRWPEGFSPEPSLAERLCMWVPFLGWSFDRFYLELRRWRPVWTAIDEELTARERTPSSFATVW